MQLSIKEMQAGITSEGRKGRYVCAACGHPLFESDNRFEAGCGFPSFSIHVSDNVTLHPLHTYGRSRIQLLCSACNGHLGHLFPSKATTTGVRYCINGDAIRFVLHE